MSKKLIFKFYNLKILINKYKIINTKIKKKIKKRKKKIKKGPEQTLEIKNIPHNNLNFFI